MNKLYFFVFSLVCFFSKAQILNAYAKVSGISGTTLTVTNLNQTSHTFTVGGKVVIMQMQDDVIGANTSNSATFGDMGAISSAGLYEIGTITACSPVGTPTSITLSTALANTYHTGTNASVQVITYRNMGASFTTTAAISGLAWNGNVGGVIAFEVTNTLTLNHAVSADIIGFRKGLINSNPVAGSCLPALYKTSSVDEAFKGEGIYKATDVTFTNGRGKILNGGGGGNEHNGGGGGGGNYTAGGAGGFGYSCGAAANNSGGLGGLSLSSYITGARIFMGGGGGGGQQNNTSGLDGGNGGGIILIKANTLVTNTVCGSAIKITANGGNTLNSGNDGAGGGGAAGTIVLQVTSYSVSATCPLAINANGGNGGNVGDPAEHGGGGGGGQGAVIFSIAQPTINMTTTTANGIGGTNNNTSSSSAGNGGGTSNAGILTAGGPLPIELLSFNGEVEEPNVKLFWITATEINNDYYTVEKSSDGINFEYLGTVKAKGTTTTISHYDLYDTKPFPVNYYRLKQTDIGGKYTYSEIVSITFEKEMMFSVFPNPAGSNEPVYVSFDKSSSPSVELSIYDITGRQIISRNIHLLNGKNNAIRINDIELAKGIYMIRLYDGTNLKAKKLIVE